MDNGIDSAQPPDRQPEPGDDFDAPDIEVRNAMSALWHAETNPTPQACRNDVEAVLTRLARGEQFLDDLMFVQELAVCLLAAGGRGTSEQGRANRVLKASGLGGKYDADREAVRQMQTIRDFGGTVPEAIAFGRRNGLISPDVTAVTDETVKKKLQRGSR